MIFRLIGIFHARRDLAAAREDAAAAMRMYAKQCKRTQHAEQERDTANAALQRAEEELARVKRVTGWEEVVGRG